MRGSLPLHRLRGLLMKAQAQEKKKKRGRGKTKGLNFLSMGPTNKIVLDFNEYGQPIGTKTRSLSTLCGLAARNPSLVPLQVDHWSELPEPALEKIWRYIKGYIEIREERRSWVLQSISKKYRDHRTELKKDYYMIWETDEKRISNPPPDVSIEDWIWLVHRWSTPEQQAISARNKSNRAKQKMSHTGGTKSFARHRDEETKSRADGTQPTRADLFIRTHTKKDGRPVDDTAGEIMAKFRDFSSSSEAGSSTPIGDDIYSQVMGPERHGRVCGYGLGPTPTSVFSLSSSQYRGGYDMHGEVEEMRRQMMAEVERRQEEHRQKLHQDMQQFQKQQEHMMTMMQQMMQNRPQHCSGDNDSDDD